MSVGPNHGDFRRGWIGHLSCRAPVMRHRRSLCWRYSASGTFTVATASRIKSLTIPKREKAFIWKIKLPPRVQCFIWLVCHHRLLANALRHHWHLTVSALCSCCNNDNETLNHALRLCPFAEAVWLRLQPPGSVLFSFALPFDQWLMFNLKYTQLSWDGLPWVAVFSISLWWIWKWSLRAVAWEPPPSSWVKLNVDADRLVAGHYVLAGVLRDHQGNWLHGFYLTIRATDVMGAEWQAIFTGLQFLQTEQINSAILESDSQLAIQLILQELGTFNPHCILQTQCQSFLKDLSGCRLQYIPRT